MTTAPSADLAPLQAATEDPVTTIRREHPEALAALQQAALLALVRIAAEQLDLEEREAA